MDLTVASSASLGFALMRLPQLVEAEYLRSPIVQSWKQGLQRIRDALPTVRPDKYRGIERCPLAEDARAPIGWAGQIEDFQPFEQKDKKARNRLREFLGSDHMCEYSPCYRIATLEQATELLSLVDSPSEYEIVKLTKALPQAGIPNKSFLGFDIGYWGGGNYSILCDTAIWPVWHPPEGESLSELAVLLDVLNENVLFPTYDFANRFRDYYRSQEWGESEDPTGDFCITLVETTN